MNLDRYSRQTILPEVGVEGQQILLDSRVLIVGAGGLGCAASQYLAAAGVGQISIADHDHVDISNLQRQVLHATEDLGMNKAESAAVALTALNPDISITALPERLAEADLVYQLASHDLIVDASDNFETRYAVNAACLKAAKPLVSGAAIRLEGQAMLLTPGRGDSACYACIFPATGSTAERCEDTGILGPMVGIIGSHQAMLAMQWLLGIGEHSGSKMLFMDAGGQRIRHIGIQRDPACPVCSRDADQRHSQGNSDE